jgi:two-component system, chemotaxis family, chemotaxis protein CheV
MPSDTNFRLHALANASVLDSVDARTRLAGSNMMELLLFSLGTEEVFGINVFKVREITRTPAIARAPNLPPAIAGLVSLRGSIIPVISLSAIVGGASPHCSNEVMMVTEFSRHVQGFLMHGIERIVRVEWSSVRAPDPMLSADNYITAVTQLPDGTLVTVLDVEQVLATAYGEPEVPELARALSSDSTVFFADDSAIARKEIARVLDRLGVRHQHAKNGREAWERLQGLAAHAQAAGEPLTNALKIVLTDAEMPEMDGYVLTRNIKNDARFNGVPVVMHSSLSSAANRSMGAGVGVDAYVAKFDPHVLADTLRPMLAAPALAE